MKQFITLFLLSFLSLYTSAQIGLPIQQSVLPKNSLVVNYDFLKSYSFTRGSGTVTNIAGTASGNATIVNSPIFFNSLGFVSLNGSNQYLITPNIRTYFKNVNTSIQTSFTMSFWVYPTANNGILVYELESTTLNNGWNASTIDIVNGYVKYRVWNGPVITSPSTINLNQWYHIAMVYDGANLKGYINGVLQGTQTTARIIPTAGQFYAIGAGGDQNLGTNAYGKFNLAQFKIYNLPFSDSDVLQDYESRKTEFDYTIHSPSTNSSPIYWSISSAWNNSSGSTGAPDAFGVYHFTPWLNSGLGWAAQTLDANQYITLNYDEPAYINGVVIQPRSTSGNQFVTKVHVETSLTGAAPWTRVVSDIPISTNITDDARVLFPVSVYAKSVKVIPVTWTNHITMRLGMLVKPNNYVTDGLVLNLDPANIKSYPGTGSTLSDLSTSINHATLTGSPTHNASRGLTFNGSTQYGRIPSVNGVTNFTNTQQYSVEIWFNPSNGQPNSGEAELLEKWDLNNESRYPYTIRFNESLSRMSVAAYDGSNNPYVLVTGFPVNTWKQLVGVFDFVAKTLTVYKDGVSAGSTSLNGVGQVSNTSPVGIAGRVAPTSGALQVPFKGTVGIIRMYNKALSSTEALQNYNNTKVRYSLIQDGLMTNLINPPSSGTTWTDASGNGNNATLNGSPTYTSSNGGGYTTSSTSYFSIPYNLPNTFTISVACSLNPSKFWATLWGNESWNAGKGYIAYLLSNSTMNLGSSTGVASISVTGINTVHIWDFVVNGTSYTVYRDGVSVGTGTFTAPSGGLSTTGLYFGARHGNDGSSYTDALPGTYYSMRVYNRALSADEINTNFSVLRGNYGL
jgi:hypothetical protein